MGQGAVESEEKLQVTDDGMTMIEIGRGRGLATPAKPEESVCVCMFACGVGTTREVGRCVLGHHECVKLCVHCRLRQGGSRGC
jgi:hypothetical protein